MAARHTILRVEELNQRILPSVSPITPVSPGQPANIGSTPSLAGTASPPSSSSSALEVVTTVNPGGPMLPATTINPGGPMVPATTVNPGGPMVPATSVNPGGPMVPAVTVNPGGPMSRNLPILANAQIDMVQPSPLLGKGSQPGQHPVIHSAPQLLAATGMTTTQLAAALKVSSINWNTQMVVIVGEGLQSYGASSPSVDITALHAVGGDLTVQWHLVQPNPNQVFPMWMRLGDPAEAVLTTEFAGPVTFHQNPTITLPAPNALDGSGSGTYTATPHIVVIDPPIGPVTNTTSLHGLVSDAGEVYNLSGTAHLSNLGNVTVSGSINGVGNIASGNATGTLTFSNAQGSVTLDVTGPSQDSFSPLPTQFQFTVASGTGAYEHMQDQGTLSLVLQAAPSPGAATGTFPASQGTFSLNIS